MLSPELQLSTTEASFSLETAKLLHLWCSQKSNTHIVKAHNNYLINFFKLWTYEQKVTQFIREAVWTRFAGFVSSPEYVYFWTTFYNTTGTKN